MRVGVGVGAVMLGGGCDAIAEAKARVLGDEAAEVNVDASATQTPAATPIATAPIAPEPLLLGRDGMAGLVDDAVARSKSPLDTNRSDPRPTAVLPIEDLGRPRSEPEGSHAFVPYAEGGSSIAAIAIAPEPPLSVEKPRTRTRPKPLRTAESEPCNPLEAPVGEWVCGPCGRG
jgi:hypothetical protein